MKVLVKDETFAGKILNEISLEFKTEKVTVSEIISERVTQEVENYNKKATGIFNGLVEPSDSEKTINGYKLKDRKVIDAEKQVYTALDAFQKNGFFLLIDNNQSENLDQVVELNKSTTISFIKLTPLVGG
jgi:hypothetical protein